MHFRRLRRRGFNQAVLIARSLQSQLPVTVSLSLTIVKKVKATEAQQSLTRKARLRNLKQVLVSMKRSLGSMLPIVDDVVTTGATVNEMSDCYDKMGCSVLMYGVLQEHRCNRSFE